MGFFSRAKQSGDFIQAWERRYGRLSRADLLIMRDPNVGFFSAWSELEDKTDWPVEQFIGNFSSWGRPSSLYWEYLIAYRSSVRTATGVGYAATVWRAQVGAIADYYPPAKWADEWATCLRSGKLKAGTVGGHEASPGQVIVGRGALELVQEQLARDELPG